MLLLWTGSWCRKKLLEWSQLLVRLISCPILFLGCWFVFRPPTSMQWGGRARKAKRRGGGTLNFPKDLVSYFVHLLVHGFLLPCQPALMRQDFRALSSMTAEESYNKAKMQLRELAEGLLNKKARVEQGHRDEEIKRLKKTTERHRKTTYLNIWIDLTVFESFEEFFSWLNLMCSNFFAHLFDLSRWKCPKLQDHYQMLWLVVWDPLCRSFFFWYHILHSQESVKRFWKNFWWILSFCCWIQDLKRDSLPHNFNRFPVVTLCHVSEAVLSKCPRTVSQSCCLKEGHMMSLDRPNFDGFKVRNWKFSASWKHRSKQNGVAIPWHFFLFCFQNDAAVTFEGSREREVWILLCEFDGTPGWFLQGQDLQLVWDDRFRRHWTTASFAGLHLPSSWRGHCLGWNGISEYQNSHSCAYFFWI